MDSYNMIKFSGSAAALGFISCVAATSALSETPMTLDFSWQGISGCSGGIRSPAFHVRNAPSGTYQLSFTLFRNQAEYGGERTPYLAGGDVPAGTIYTNGPCEPGDYRWEVVALDRLGSALATAHRGRPFP
jgi:hypothetical protein